jgi:hypothetical protein
MAQDPGTGSTSAGARDDTYDATAARDVVTERRDGNAVAHDRFGGIKWGAAFFGWLAANGLNVILVALLAAAGAAIGLTQTTPQEATDRASSQASTVGIGGAIALLVVLAIGYYAGGYVAGRMSRFDGARQGVAVWLIGLLVTIALAVAGAVFGAKYNVLSRLDLPRIPVDEGTLGSAGIIALAAVLLVTLAAAVLGGKAGERFHRKVDRAGRDI